MESSAEDVQDKAIRSFSRYAVAVLVAAAVILIRWTLNALLATHLPFLALSGAVAVAVWYGGFGPGLLTTLLGYLAASYLFVDPTLKGAGYLVGSLLYFISCAIIIAFGAGMKAAERHYQAAALEALSKQRQLEEEMIERNRADERFRLAVEASPSGVIMVNEEGRIILVNSQTERIFGYSREELIGQPIEMLAPERFRSRHPEYRGSFAAAPQARPMGTGRDLYGLRKNGSEVPVEIGLNPIEVNGKTLVLSTIVDITERKQREEALRLSESRLRAVLETTLNAVVGMDEKGYITYWNAQSERIFGWSETEARGRKMSETIIPERFRESHEVGLKRFLSTGEAPILNRRIEITALRRNGTEFPIELSATYHREDGQYLFYGFISDITERKQFEESLKQKTMEAEEANRVKSEFLSSVSHELRTPLNAIIGYSALLKEPDLLKEAPDPTEMLDRIDYNSHVLLELINNVLDLSRIEAGRIQIQVEEISLMKFVREAINSLEPLRAEKGLEMILQEDPTAPLIRTDPGKLRQILTNLIGNAIKFTERGSITVRIFHPSDEQKIYIEVKDTGIGISEKDRSHIFEPFYQADSSDTRSYGGTGLGLSIVKKLTDSLGGTIQAASQLGLGSTFTVCLPYTIEGTKSDTSI